MGFLPVQFSQGKLQEVLCFLVTYTPSLNSVSTGNIPAFVHFSHFFLIALFLFLLFLFAAFFIIGGLRCVGGLTVNHFGV